MGNKFSEVFWVSEDAAFDDSISDAQSDDVPFAPNDVTKKPSNSFLDFLYRNRLFIVAVALIAILMTVIPYAILEIVHVTVEPTQYTCSIDVTQRIPCTNNGINSTSSQCLTAGCCWDGKSVNVNGSTAPYCFHSYPSKYDYVVQQLTDSQNITFQLTPSNSGSKSFSESPRNMRLTVDRVSKNYVRIRGVIKDNPPVPLLWPDLPSTLESDASMEYGIVNSLTNDRFTLSVYRHMDNVTLVTMNGGPFTLTNNYTEYTIYTPTTNVYGLGEADHKTLKHSMNFEQWQFMSRSQLKSDAGRHYYGVQPFYMCIEKSGNVHGVLFGINQPALVSLQPGLSISIKTSGQLIEMHAFTGPTPKDVMEQYTKVIGRPAMPPYWGLGYHTCRSNGNVSIATKIANALYENNIPHESDCGDSLMLRSLSIPSNGSKVYKDFGSISDLLHNSNRKLVLFQGPSVNNATSQYDQGVSDNIFIRNTSYTNYFGRQNNRAVVYPDFHNPATTSWLTNLYLALKNQIIEFDGMFLVDNTPLDQSANSPYQCLTNVSIPPISEYMMNYFYTDNDTICLTALQSDKTTPHSVWHNTYGKDHIVAVASSIHDSFLLTNSERPFLVSLSSFPGTSQYGGRWSGDFDTSWTSLNDSLIQTIEFGLYGTPFTGNPICGYRQSISSENLCWKWMQMSAFFPLAFSFYGPNEQPREPTFFTQAFQTMTRDVLNLRYLLLPYIYTLFYQAHQNGEPIIRPLFYEFPNDNNTWTNKAQFMLGPSLLVSPSLTTQPEFIAYFPKGTWYEFQTQRKIESEKGAHYHLLASQHFPNIHVKAGSIIPLQTPGLNTVSSRMNPFNMAIILGSNSTETSGQLYIDDGDSSDDSMLIELGANNTAFWWTVTITGDTVENVNTNISSISVTGLEEQLVKDSLCVIEPEYNCLITHVYNSYDKLLMIDISSWNYTLESDFLISWSINTNPNHVN